MKSIKFCKICRVFVYSLLILFFIVCTGLFIVLRCCNLSYYVILSGSMQPDINIDDLIVSQNLNEKDAYDALNVGDIATYFDGKDYVTHRVFEKAINSKTGIGVFVFKGDNNNTIDRNTVYANQIKGKYLTKIDGGAYIFEFLNSVHGIISIVVILMLLFMIDNTLVYAINFKTQKLDEAMRDDVSDSEKL